MKLITVPLNRTFVCGLTLFFGDHLNVTWFTIQNFKKIVSPGLIWISLSNIIIEKSSWIISNPVSKRTCNDERLNIILWLGLNSETILWRRGGPPKLHVEQIKIFIFFRGDQTSNWKQRSLDRRFLENEPLRKTVHPGPTGHQFLFVIWS